MNIMKQSYLRLCIIVMHFLVMSVCFADPPNDPPIGPPLGFSWHPLLPYSTEPEFEKSLVYRIRHPKDVIADALAVLKSRGISLYPMGYLPSGEKLFSDTLSGEIYVLNELGDLYRDNVLDSNYVEHLTPYVFWNPFLVDSTELENLYDPYWSSKEIIVPGPMLQDRSGPFAPWAYTYFTVEEYEGDLKRYNEPPPGVSPLRSYDELFIATLLWSSDFKSGPSGSSGSDVYEQILEFARYVAVTFKSSNKSFLGSRWHRREQSVPARDAVINPSSCFGEVDRLTRLALTTDDFTALADRMWAFADIVGNRWGNCAEKAVGLAAMIHVADFGAECSNIQFRVEYSQYESNKHAWVHVKHNSSSIIYDPWRQHSGLLTNYPKAHLVHQHKATTAWFYPACAHQAQIPICCGDGEKTVSNSPFYNEECDSSSSDAAGRACVAPRVCRNCKCITP